MKSKFLILVMIVMSVLIGCGSRVKETGAINGADPSVVIGTYLGNSGSAFTIYSNGTADYYWVGWEDIQTGNEWNYDGTQLTIHVATLKCDVYATIIGDRVSDVPFNSTSKNWDAENFTKVLNNADHWTVADYKKMFDAVASETTVNSSASESIGLSNDENSTNSQIVDGDISPDFKQEVDDMETFYNSYCDFMEKYAKAVENGDVISMMDQYTKLLSDYAVYEQKLEYMNNNQKSMTQAELNYFLDAYNRIMKRMANVAYSVN